MRDAAKVLRYQLHDVLRSRWVLIYTLLFLLLTGVLVRFGGEGDRVVLSLMNVVLIFIPLVSLMFGTLYLYNAREFVELLLAQPLDRGALFAGLYGGLALPLVLGFVTGVGLPFLVYSGGSRALIVLLGTGVLLTLVFTALAFLIATRLEDKAKGLGAALLLWLFCAVIYDGLVLLVTMVFGDYPLEKPLLILTLFNPVDLGRVLLLLNFDIAALMGYTGAVFSRFFGSSAGLSIAAGALLGWAVIPLRVALGRFRAKDF